MVSYFATPRRQTRCGVELRVKNLQMTTFNRIFNYVVNREAVDWLPGTNKVSKIHSGVRPLSHASSYVTYYPKSDNDYWFC